MMWNGRTTLCTPHENFFAKSEEPEFVAERSTIQFQSAHGQRRVLCRTTWETCIGLKSEKVRKRAQISPRWESSWLACLDYTRCVIIPERKWEPRGGKREEKANLAHWFSVSFMRVNEPKVAAIMTLGRRRKLALGDHVIWGRESWGKVGKKVGCIDTWEIISSVIDNLRNAGLHAS